MYNSTDVTTPPSTMTWLHHHHCRLLFLGCFSSFTHCQWMWPLIRITVYVPITFLSAHIVAIYPLGGLLLNFSSSIATTTPMMIDIASAPQLYPPFFMLETLHLYPLFFLLADHPSKIVQNQWYDGAALIAPKGWNSWGISHSQ